MTSLSASTWDREQRPIRSRRRLGHALLAVTTIAFLGTSFAAAPASAEESGDEKLDLTFERPGQPDTWLRPSARADTAWFTGFNEWGGKSKANIGGQSDGWMELGIVPGLDAQVSLGDYGTLSARLSGVWTTTQIGLDYAGSNRISGQTQAVDAMTLEDAYVRWTSGSLISGLDKDALELSVGSQTYQVSPGDVGAGFLFYNGGSDGGSRGGFWLGLRNAFELAAIARLKSGGWMVETVYLRSDERYGDHTNVVGGNASYDLSELTGLPAFTIGAGYWNIVDSDDTRRDNMSVGDLRLDLKPFSSGLPGLRLTAEGVKEKAGKRNDSWAAWGELGYDFADNEVEFSPYVSGRYVYFSGDDPGDSRDNAFDPLFYGFSDWNTWYLGEISGEWITGNSNFQATVLRLRASPVESVTTQFFWIYQRLNEKQSTLSAPGGRPVDPRVLSISDKNLSHEFDFIVDWTVNDYLSTSFVGAVLVPLDGGKQFFGEDDVWGQFMLYASIKI